MFNFITQKTYIPWSNWCEISYFYFSHINVFDSTGDVMDEALTTDSNGDTAHAEREGAL